MKTKVLMFGWEFPPHNSGGLGTACQGLTKALVAEKIEITFVLPKKNKDIDDSFLRIISPETSYMNFHRFDSPLSPYLGSTEYFRAISFSPGLVYGQSLFEEVLRYAIYGGNLAERETFDIIHAHDWLSFGAGIKAKERTGKQLVVHVHATEFDRGGGEGIDSRVYQIEKEGMEKADKVIVVSAFTKNIVIENYGISPEKIVVVHNGIDCFDCDFTSKNIHKIKEKGNKIVLFTGRITLQKGPDYFIRSAKEVLSCMDNVFFVLCGSGDMEQQIMEETAKLGISDRVLFTGFLRGERLQEMYRLADLFVMPSVSEPFGITPLEALASGTPVLISKQSGVSEVLYHALKVDFWDTREMANKIISALQYSPLSQCLCQEGLKELPKISWKNAARKCINIYTSLLS